MKSCFRNLTAFAFTAGSFFMPLAVFAQGSFVEGVQGGVNKAGAPLGFGANTPKLEETIGMLISGFLSLLGVVLLCYLIYAGFLWMTAGGNTEQVKKARAMITNAIIGLVITFASYAITDFVFKRLAGPAGGDTVQDG